MSERNLNTVQNTSTSASLDDEQRVKVLSPGRMVIKRFFRNRLAMVGVFIIAAMFLFSFLGGILTPYGEKQVFRTTEIVLKDYAGVTENTDWKYSIPEGKDFPAAAQAKLILAVNKGEDTFEAKDKMYKLIEQGEEIYRVVTTSEIAKVVTLRGKANFTETVQGALTQAIQDGYEKAVSEGKTEFEADRVEYSVIRQGKISSICVSDTVALASKYIFAGSMQDTELSFAFQEEALLALAGGITSFQADGEIYTVEPHTAGTMILKDKEEYVLVSHYSISPVTNGVFLSLQFREAVIAAIDNASEEFEFGETTYILQRKNTQYMVRSYTETQVNKVYASPSKEHWLGTDGNGMDVLTRLMYGGRISLLVGFVVVLLEVVLGIMMGGIAGYFGGWVDSLIMRIVDVFYCIPSMPLFIILGSIMDYMKLEAKLRIFLMCAMLGLLGWASVARMVRGQILSLREQEFMMAAEALGISVHRRIFVHLIPNVVPQLVVIATMGLGSTILTEATLSFLGLGVKFPYASWGNIIQAVNNSYVMTNFLFVWVPAGLLILLTVLGFNFIGDGLRDAFDPKMKR